MRRVLALIVLCAGTVSLLAEQPPTAKPAIAEARKHYRLLRPGGLPDYDVTVIDQTSEERLRVIGLVADRSGKRFTLTWDRDFVHQTSSREIRLTGEKEFLSYRMFLPFTARTRTATIAEAHAYPELTKDAEKFEFTGPGNSRLEGSDKFWDDPETAREWRKRVRAMVMPSFLEAVEILQSSGVFRFPNFADYAVMTPMILYRTECESAVPEPDVQAMPPDCSFDEGFGFPCSEKQRARAEKALKAEPPAAKAY